MEKAFWDGIMESMKQEKPNYDVEILAQAAVITTYGIVASYHTMMLNFDIISFILIFFFSFGAKFWTIQTAVGVPLVAKNKKDNGEGLLRWHLESMKQEKLNYDVEILTQVAVITTYGIAASYPTKMLNVIF
ncbi:hypothetical protein QYF36_009052 [Acer negundo]|nr:hypothetical protein QYF36_009052 [Acer negundo]